jgi:hypothetical protein
MDGPQRQFGFVRVRGDRRVDVLSESDAKPRRHPLREVLSVAGLVALE